MNIISIKMNVLMIFRFMCIVTCRRNKQNYYVKSIYILIHYCFFPNTIRLYKLFTDLLRTNCNSTSVVLSSPHVIYSKPDDISLYFRLSRHNLMLVWVLIVVDRLHYSICLLSCRLTFSLVRFFLRFFHTLFVTQGAYRLDVI